MDLQDNCPLFRLPAELRSQIYCLCLTAGTPIIDLAIGSSTNNSKYKHIPPLGRSLLRTCRRIHAEVDIRPLYSSNEFSFTHPYVTKCFLSHLPAQFKPLVTDITLDLREFFSTGGERNTLNIRRLDDFISCDCSGNPTIAHCHPAGPHLYRHTPPRGPVKTVTLDICTAQLRAAKKPVPDLQTPASACRPSGIGYWGYWWEDNLWAVRERSESGVRVRVRWLDPKKLVREGELPLLSSIEAERIKAGKMRGVEWGEKVFGAVDVMKLFTPFYFDDWKTTVKIAEQ